MGQAFAYDSYRDCWDLAVILVQMLLGPRFYIDCPTPRELFASSESDDLIAMKSRTESIGRLLGPLHRGHFERSASRLASAAIDCCPALRAFGGQIDRITSIRA